MDVVPPPGSAGAELPPRETDEVPEERARDGGEVPEERTRESAQAAPQPTSESTEAAALPPYRPIDCALHDRLEAAATLRRTVVLRYLSEGGEREETRARITDVFARDKQEFLRLASGLELRLDRLVSIEDAPTAAPDAAPVELDFEG